MRVVSEPMERDTARPGLRADMFAFGVALGVVAVVAWVGYLLNQVGAPLYADTAPLFAQWRPHVGIGTPLAVVASILVVAYGPTLAAGLSWSRLLGAGYLTALLWTFSLAMIEGWQHGIAQRLTDYTSQQVADQIEIADVASYESVACHGQRWFGVAVRFGQEYVQQHDLVATVGQRVGDV